MSNKRLISVVLVICLVCGFGLKVYGYADHAKVDYKEGYEINQYIEDNYWDLLGMKGEDLYFKLREKYAGKNPLKILMFDLKNSKLQTYLTMKCFEDNEIIYFWVGGIGMLVKLKKGKFLYTVVRKMVK